MSKQLIENKNICIMFPGQGVKFHSIDRELFARYSHVVRQADTVLGYSIEELCFEDSDSLLSTTEYMQPALYVVNHLSYLNFLDNERTVPSYFIGNSLGEYNALTAAGYFSFEEGLKLVALRGRFMQEVSEGIMSAIIGMTTKAIQNKIEALKIEDQLFISNMNSLKQSVISGAEDAVEVFEKSIESETNVKSIRLDVGAAFHTPYMRQAEVKFTEHLSSLQLQTPHSNVIANKTALPYTSENFLKNLKTQITSPVLLSESFNYLLEKNLEFVEVGPGRTMTGILAKCQEEYHSKLLIDSKKYAYGSATFLRDYETDYPCVIGTTKKGIFSKEMAEILDKENIVWFYGTYGLDADQVSMLIDELKKRIPINRIGISVTKDSQNEEIVNRILDVVIDSGIERLELVGFTAVSEKILRYRYRTNPSDVDSETLNHFKLMIQCSNSRTAENFLSEKVLAKKFTDYTKQIMMKPICDDFCFDGELNMISSIYKLEKQRRMDASNNQQIRIGYSGKIGSPDSAAIAFFAQADFIVFHTLAQLTNESRLAPYIKEKLLVATDTDFIDAITEEYFEFGEQKKVLKKGTLFHVYAKKMFEIYQQYPSLEAIPAEVKNKIETQYFSKTFEEIISGVQAKDFQIAEVEKYHPKRKLCLVFKEYLARCADSACEDSRCSNYQVVAGEELSEYSTWLREKGCTHWSMISIADIFKLLMEETAESLNSRLKELTVLV